MPRGKKTMISMTYLLSFVPMPTSRIDRPSIFQNFVQVSTDNFVSDSRPMAFRKSSGVWMVSSGALVIRSMGSRFLGGLLMIALNERFGKRKLNRRQYVRSRNNDISTVRPVQRMAAMF